MFGLLHSVMNKESSMKIISTINPAITESMEDLLVKVDVTPYNQEEKDVCH